MSATGVIQALKGLSFKNAFNPYVDRCSVHDTAHAPELRERHLSHMLECAHRVDLDAIWVGRDLGYRGGRRTGLALTDAVHFPDHLQRWGLPPQALTYGKPVAERTATVVWRVLPRNPVPVLLWNVFPLAPFREGAEFSNRAQNAREREAGMDILDRIIGYVEPGQIIAIGNDAFSAVSAAFPRKRIRKARHPSYGGQSEFLANMEAVYPQASLKPAPPAELVLTHTVES